jgi:hypothetical protein
VTYFGLKNPIAVLRLFAPSQAIHNHTPIGCSFTSHPQSYSDCLLLHKPSAIIFRLFAPSQATHNHTPTLSPVASVLGSLLVKFHCAALVGKACAGDLYFQSQLRRQLLIHQSRSWQPLFKYQPRPWQSVFNTNHGSGNLCEH